MIERGCSLRAVAIDGQLWFLAKDVGALKALDCGRKGYLGYVYALEIGDGVKIGMTTQPQTRLQSIASIIAVYGGREPGRVLLSQPHTNYQLNESALHSAFDDVRAGREMFDLSLDELISTMPALQFLDESREMAEEAERVGKRIRKALDRVLLGPIKEKSLFILRIDHELWTYHGRPGEAFALLADMAEKDGFSFLDGDVYVSNMSGMRAVCLEDLVSDGEATA